jgi:hypothetical protein
MIPYNTVLDKVALIDYLTVSFYDFNIKQLGKNDYIINDERFQDLLFLLGYRGVMKNMQYSQPIHNFAHTILVNEFTKISYGGETTASNGRYTLSVEMSGKACREFERHSGHEWVDLFDFIFSQDDFKVSRVDFAIDDFTGAEITLPYIRDLLEKCLYSSPTRNGTFYSSWKRKNDSHYTAGYTLNLGVRGSNQLRIYDKRHEQLSQGLKVHHEIWNRYELEMHDEKATEVLNHYYLALLQQDTDDNRGADLKAFVQGLLRNFLDLKDPEDKNTRVRRKKTDPKWLAFLDSISKIDIRVQPKHIPSYDVKLKWIDKSLPTTFAELAMAKDIEGLLDTVYDLVITGLKNMKSKHRARINDYLITNGQERMDDNKISEFVDLIERLREAQLDSLEEELEEENTLGKEL